MSSADTPAFVETHAHLDSRRFDTDRNETIERAMSRGIAQIVTVGADLRSSQAAIKLAERYSHIHATVGIHPHDAKSVGPVTVDALCKLVGHPRVVAIGEIGLDFYRNYAPHDVQVSAFKEQLALAAELSKPVVVHIRDRTGERGAYDVALGLLRTWLQDAPPSSRAAPGVLHCYSGNLEVARAAIELGFYLGVDGPVTYPNALALQSVVAQLPLKRLLLETDCPFLSPQVRRGRRNEPAYIPYIAEKVAELHNVTVAQVARVTSANAFRLFGFSNSEMA
jgi:TatD DNase family protein